MRPPPYISHLFFFLADTELQASFEKKNFANYYLDKGARIFAYCNWYFGYGDAFACFYQLFSSTCSPRCYLTGRNLQLNLNLLKKKLNLSNFQFNFYWKQPLDMYKKKKRYIKRMSTNLWRGQGIALQQPKCSCIEIWKLAALNNLICLDKHRRHVTSFYSLGCRMKDRKRFFLLCLSF